MPRKLVYHPASTCPNPVATSDGLGADCPGHYEDPVPTREQLRATCIAYGRGYRRCFEDLLRNRPAQILLVSGQGLEQLRDVIRERLERDLGPDFADGWDSVDRD